MRLILRAVLAVVATAAITVLPGTTPASADTRGPDECRMGYVWREATAGDHLCVTPGVRTRTRAENAQAAQRREPGGGPYGPDTCRQGFVWRETRPDDHVCVTPDVRTEARNLWGCASGRAPSRSAANIALDARVRGSGVASITIGGGPAQDPRLALFNAVRPGDAIRIRVTGGPISWTQYPLYAGETTVGPEGNDLPARSDWPFPGHSEYMVFGKWNHAPNSTFEIGADSGCVTVPPGGSAAVPWILWVTINDWKSDDNSGAFRVKADLWQGPRS